MQHNGVPRGDSDTVQQRATTTRISSTGPYAGGDGGNALSHDYMAIARSFHPSPIPVPPLSTLNRNIMRVYVCARPSFYLDIYTSIIKRDFRIYTHIRDAAHIQRDRPSLILAVAGVTIAQGVVVCFSLGGGQYDLTDGHWAYGRRPLRRFIY